MTCNKLNRVGVMALQVHVLTGTRPYLLVSLRLGVFQQGAARWYPVPPRKARCLASVAPNRHYWTA